MCNFRKLWDIHDSTLTKIQKWKVRPFNSLLYLLITNFSIKLCMSLEMTVTCSSTLIRLTRNSLIDIE